jgi:cell division transport system permease protein
LKITLTPQYRTSTGTQEVYDRLVAMRGIESVVYRKALLELIDKRAAGLNKVMLTLGLVISLSAIFLVSNTIRLAIRAKQSLIQTMELVGATRGFIRLPFLLEGSVQGLCGGLLAAALLAGLLGYGARLVSAEFAPYLRMAPAFYGGLVCAGILLGFAGSIISVVRFVRPVAAH